jgi:hypothetical protein
MQEGFEQKLVNFGTLCPVVQNISGHTAAANVLNSGVLSEAGLWWPLLIIATFLSSLFLTRDAAEHAPMTITLA